MESRDYKVTAHLVGPDCEAEFEEMEADAVFDVKRDGDDLIVTYEAGGNVDAIQHLRSLISELEAWDLEADELKIAAERVG